MYKQVYLQEDKKVGSLQPPSQVIHIFIQTPRGSDGRNKPVFMKQLLCIYASGDIAAPHLLIKFIVPAYSIKDYLKKFEI
jgi:hypothetical protein